MFTIFLQFQSELVRYSRTVEGAFPVAVPKKNLRACAFLDFFDRCNVCQRQTCSARRSRGQATSLALPFSATGSGRARPLRLVRCSIVGHRLRAVEGASPYGFARCSVVARGSWNAHRRGCRSLQAFSSRRLLSLCDNVEFATQTSPGTAKRGMRRAPFVCFSIVGRGSRAVEGASPYGLVQYPELSCHPERSKHRSAVFTK